jgi:hypothetical protein
MQTELYAKAAAILAITGSYDTQCVCVQFRDAIRCLQSISQNRC